MKEVVVLNIHDLKMISVEDELRSFMRVWLSAAASLCYCYFISSKIPKGFF